MLRKMLAIGYEQNEFKKICQCFRAMDHTIELIRADSPSEAAFMLQSNQIDCVVAHHSLLDYLPFINLLRSINSIPILLLTYEKACAVAPDILRFHCTETSSDELLENGADVESRKPPITIIKAAEMELHLEQRVAMLCGNDLALTPKEFDILSLLISNPKRGFTYEMIIDIVWHEDLDFYSQRVIHHHISNINRKIRQICSGKKYIKSIYGVGYKFDV